MPSRFIVLEALDGVGKTTLATDLATRLGGLVMDTPGPDLRSCASAVLAALGQNQIARGLFYAASVLDAGDRARVLVSKGTNVVMDRYWLSTVSYARARGAAVDLGTIEHAVAAPDVTVLLTLDEGERQRRLRERGCTDADRQTLDGAFRDHVLREMRSTARPTELRPTFEVDLTGAGREEAVERVLRGLARGSQSVDHLNGPTPSSP